MPRFNSSFVGNPYDTACRIADIEATCRTYVERVCGNRFKVHYDSSTKRWYAFESNAAGDVLRKESDRDRLKVVEKFYINHVRH